MLEVLALIFFVLRVVIVVSLTTVIYVIDLNIRHAPFEKMLNKCRSCLYFSKARCLKFGKKLEEGFYTALECRQNENKCGSQARWYLERLNTGTSNAVDVHGGKADGNGR